MPHWNKFADFLRDVQNVKNGLELRPHQECYYRGHSDTKFRLLPSLFRGLRTDDDECWKLERRIFFEFRTRARQLYGVDHSDWDVLFHMQHHGVPTRLLDWTSIFGVALYFALLEHQADESRLPCVWIMNPYALNHAAWDKHRLFSTTLPEDRLRLLAAPAWASHTGAVRIRGGAHAAEGRGGGCGRVGAGVRAVARAVRRRAG
jgi:hypothetical protein